MREVYIVDAARTAIGAFGGAFAKTGARELGAIVLKALCKRQNLDPAEVDEVLLGNVLQAGQGQNVARQVAVDAGVPVEKTAMSINMVCGSGLRSIMLGAQAIALGDAQVIIAGGTENMSQAPYLLPAARTGMRMGNSTAVDSMINDGLWDAFNDYHMGITAENLAEKFQLSREEQDVFAASQNKAEAAQKSGRFAEEIVPVALPQRKGEPVIVDTDEFPRHGCTAEGLGKLRPAFKKDGTVTAANASGINDGAAAVILADKETCERLSLKPLAKITGYGQAGVDPSIMGFGPVEAVKKALKKADWNIEDLDLIEANEAFASQAMSVNKALGWDAEKVNVNGGAIALGHPIGASGCRILVTLIHEMKKREAKRGLATLCIGGGMGVALAVEACQPEAKS